VEAKSNEITAIPALLERLAASGALAGALITIDAIACNPDIAQSIADHGADYLLAVKANQPSLLSEIERFFGDAPEAALDRHTDLDKGHGRIEERRCTVSQAVDWMEGARRFPGERRFPRLKAIAMIESRVETKDSVRTEQRFSIAAKPMTAKAFGEAVRGHWGIANALHWVLDVSFKGDLSRVRKGHGAQNMAVVRHFALNLVRTARDRKSIKLPKKTRRMGPRISPKPHLTPPC
jgi:predicted transposase YbfD/YdcC